MSSVIDNIERRQRRQGLPSFAPGDRVRVHFQVVEGNRRRTQVFEGIVLKRQGSGIRETFTVRKQSFGVGVERTFPLHSPKIEKLEIAARGDVRRAKLYYLRGRIGKAARVAERRWGIDDELISAPVPPEPDTEEPQDAGPVAEEDSSSSPEAAGEESTSTPPASEAPQGDSEGADASAAAEEVEAPEAEAEGTEEPAAEAEKADAEAEKADAEAETEVEAGTDAEAPEAGETEDTAAAQDAEDEPPQEDPGDSGEDSA
jgi:large subunit ribosomal protein L19